MSNPNIKLSVYQNGQLAREPVLLTETGLREALLLATDYDEQRVEFVCQCLHEQSKCEMSAGEKHPVYVIEKVLNS